MAGAKSKKIHPTTPSSLINSRKNRVAQSSDYSAPAAPLAAPLSMFNAKEFERHDRAVAN
jgi:hypothetical protein